MQTAEKSCSRNLEEGQLWKLEHGYVWIEELGEHHIRYKMLRNADFRAAITQLIREEALLNFLRQTEAVLVRGGNSAGLESVAVAA
jgi:hypothetical protein